MVRWGHIPEQPFTCIHLQHSLINIKKSAKVRDITDIIIINLI